MAKSLRSNANKSEQIARYLLQHGDYMTARQMADAGFTYEDGTVDSAGQIGSVLNKLHESSRFVVDRVTVSKKGCGRSTRETRVKVLSIAPRRPTDSNGVDVAGSEPNLWRQLLSRRGNAPLKLRASGEAG